MKKLFIVLLLFICSFNSAYANPHQVVEKQLAAKNITPSNNEYSYLFKSIMNCEISKKATKETNYIEVSYCKNSTIGCATYFDTKTKESTSYCADAITRLSYDL